MVGIAVQPAALLPQFDLVIATRKTPLVSSQAEAPILWWKLAGREREVPPRRCNLLDPLIQQRLATYELVGTEARQGMVVRRYRRKEGVGNRE